ncbi:MAG: glutathione S-transferase C-terminal domain-containing protein [Polyangiales bacterium]
MLTLHGMPGAGVVPSFSPPCAKLEGWLRLTGIPYQWRFGDPAAAPRQKLPYLDDDGRALGDATLLLPYLCARYGVDPDARLSPEARASAVLARRALKEHLYWAIVYARWVPDEGFAAYGAALAEVLPAALPLEVRTAVVGAWRDVMRGQLHAQGTGRFDLDAVTALATETVGALAVGLGARRYFGGEEPCTLDVTCWASLTNILDVPGAPTLDAAVRAHPNLTDHTARMGRRLFPERFS